MIFARFHKFVEVMTIRGVKVNAHLSVVLIVAAIPIIGWQYPLLSFVKALSYFKIILIHECGHLVLAQRKRCHVSMVELYPFWGITKFSEPYSRLELCVIAWGGVVAQMFIAIPLVAWGGDFWIHTI